MKAKKKKATKKVAKKKVAKKKADTKIRDLDLDERSSEARSILMSATDRNMAALGFLFGNQKISVTVTVKGTKSYGSKWSFN